MAWCDMWYVLVYCETIDGQNIQTLRKRLDWHLRPQMSKLNNVCVTCPAVGFDFFCPPVSTLGRKQQLWKFVHVKTVALLSSNFALDEIWWCNKNNKKQNSETKNGRKSQVQQARGKAVGGKSWQVFKPPLDAAAFRICCRDFLGFGPGSVSICLAFASKPSDSRRVRGRKREREQKTQSQQPLHPRPGYAFSYRFLQSVGLPTQHSSAKESFHHRLPSCFARHLYLL